MSAPEFTAAGVQIQTFQEILAELVAGYQTIYGADIDLSPDSPDGQRVAIEAQARYDLQAFGASVVAGLDADAAEGTALIMLAKMSGLFPLPASKSQWDLSVTTDRGLTLPAGYTVEDIATGTAWVVSSDAACTTGVNTVSFFAEEFGNYPGALGAAFTVTTPVLGVTAIAASADATAGADGETDPQFRARRNTSLGNPAYSVTGALFAKLGNLAGVTDVNVHENDTQAPDAFGVPGNTIWAIVEGGVVSEIAEVLAKQKTGGAAYYGAETTTYVETLTKPNGSTFTITHPVKFDRPTEIPVDITLTVTHATADAVDLAQIKAQLAAAEYSIGQDMQAGELYQLTYGAGPSYIVTALQLNRGGGATAGRIVAAIDEKFTIAVADITITEVVI